MKRIDQKVFLVIPTIRDLEFLTEWNRQFEGVSLIIVEDGPEKTVTFDKNQFWKVHHYCWRDIDEELGKDSWVISRQNAGIRSYGFWKAYEMGAEVIITIDDDCYPADTNLVEKHIDNLGFIGAEKWVTTYPDPEWMYTRGIPYDVRDKNQIMVSHGLWSGAIDLDAITEVKLPKLLSEEAYPPLRQVIPRGYFYPMCSMNLAFTREVVPLMFFPMMGGDPEGGMWEYDRYDDIWAGIISKKIMDHLGWGVVNGSPWVEHRKASEPGVNVKKEAKGMKMNEDVWKAVDEVELTQSEPASCYIELAEKMDLPEGEYFKRLGEAMKIWARLFER